MPRICGPTDSPTQPTPPTMLALCTLDSYQSFLMPRLSQGSQTNLKSASFCLSGPFTACIGLASPRTLSICYACLAERGSLPHGASAKTQPTCGCLTWVAPLFSCSCHRVKSTRSGTSIRSGSTGENSTALRTRMHAQVSTTRIPQSTAHLCPGSGELRRAVA